MFLRNRFMALLAILITTATIGGVQARHHMLIVPAASGPVLPHPIMFVTQVPIPDTFTTIGAVFGNHEPTMGRTGRGGDLWIRYEDGTLKNLTAAIGYGSSDPTGFQGANGIAVRDPSIYWDGTKAVFSMVVGGPTKQYESGTYYWQLYEISGLGINQTPVITKVPNQPAEFNNISPIYGTDDRIIFVSDRPRNGARHLYPQFDEYELTPVNTGLWSLNPADGNLFQIDHSPSGDFTPTIDSFGRVIFTRWDHLQRDQEADQDATDFAEGNQLTYGTFNYSDESPGATYQWNQRPEVFPEPRVPASGSNASGHTFNFFGPWEVNEDGTEAETLNHIGRHEFGIYAGEVFTDDANLTYLSGSQHANTYDIRSDGGLLHIKESPVTRGLYYTTYSREFATQSSGQILTLTGAPNLNADQMELTPITHPDTANPDDTPGPDHSGLYREPLPLTNGQVAVVHTTSTLPDDNIGTTENPLSRYDLRLKLLINAPNGYQSAGPDLTGGINKTVKYWNPDVLITYSGPMWELNAVEVRARPRPPRRNIPLAPPELDAFARAGVDPALFKAYLTQNNLALAVSRNITRRDNAEQQQPFNLRVPGGVQTIGAGGKIYDVAAMQFFQADMLRGKHLYKNGDTPDEGRRVLAQPLHEPAAIQSNSSQTGSVPGSVIIAPDGSVAAFVPTRRAMSWQIVDPAGAAVVRERLWITFQPGEIRVCASCHGLNNIDQAGNSTPTNTPEALVQLLENWKARMNLAPRVYLPVVRQ